MPKVTNRGRILRWGNSAALRLPIKMLAAMNVAVGAEVESSVERGRLIIVPVTSRAETLDDLCARITPENRHGETEWGPDVGAEIY